jgi:two-component system LytT family response regulator
MLKAIIIDDEEGARETLKTLIQNYCTDITIEACFGNVPEGVVGINKIKPDLVFLDIEMPDYNGFELFGFFQEINFEIIFVTAYNEYALKAFEVSAIDYLLKPVELDGLQKAIQKVKEKKTLSNMSQRLELMNSISKGEEIKRITLPMNDGLLFVEVADIILFAADRAYTDVYLKNGSKITVSKPMRIFEDILNNRPLFFRPHRSHLINLNYVRKYLRGESNIIMDNNVEVSISREKKQEFESKLKELRISV